MLFLLPSSSAAAISTYGQTYRNISLRSSLTAGSDNLPWTSPSGDFSFGFQQVGDAGYLLAIWFNKIPDRTIVWSANRNDLAQGGSRVQLTEDGELVLNDQSGRQIWIRPQLGGSGAAYAAMPDSGNFVLASQAGVNLWQSFDEPTDTLLPTQNLNSGAQLIASYLENKNYSEGRYKFILQADGNLILYTTHYPLTTSNFAYWSTGSSIGSGYQVIFNQSGYMYLVARNGTLLNPVFSNSVSIQDFYLRATLDYDGVLRQYVYPKTASSSGNRAMAWTTVSNSIPSNICLEITGQQGSGACGFNSYCRLGDDQRPSCKCPPGYTFFDPNDERKGCKKNFISQDCDHPSQEIDSFEIKEMPNTNWPFNDYEMFGSVDEDWCRQACLSDCYCAVAIFNTAGQCWMKRVPLSNGVIDPSVSGKALIKVRKGNSTAGSSAKKCDRPNLIITGSVLLGCSIFLIVLSLLGIYVFFSRWNRQKQKLIPQHHVMPAMNMQNFTYSELERSTGGFKEELGSGAFGTVYKGALANEDKPLIAVKKLDKMAGEGDKEFNTEVKVIGRTNHKNLVQLVGFCNEGQHRLLVYEYMSNGSLANFLFGDSRPNWNRRMQIAFDIARGLLYLHEECSFQIIHCDIKPQNILLDESLNARISDFGLAKLLKTDQTKTTTAIRGTKGYVAPEWFKNLPVTTKVDTYSFGILLLELVCCRKKFDIDKKECQIVLADWACDCLKEGKLDLLVEDDEEATEDMERVERFVMVAILCIQEDPSLSPGMKKVVQMLEGGVQVSVPPDLSSFISTI
ncbi:PREDICTED: LOW QUALITY PROTEIN: G-type lectin S-receptor-like serine/threonine-protein kinase RLK1 [Populus euphratica]|uniref:Receptor-like serine/threonine-protein kinase n=1 Tax=Populus euphratica TaxID=75702 RepID=A0AAJ6U958_POPEU|nr:PREDICTED: LOW QUALITY PROTEIN: G-type lectin S-receptor-like serine/threonine-protein kinase RLK1 [Populus euphratica]